MSDLQNYFTLQDRIVELEQQLAKKETTIRTLRISRSQYKQRYREAMNLTKPPTRKELVRTILYKVKAGEVTLTHREIAKKFHVSLHYVRELSCNINKELRSKG